MTKEDLKEGSSLEKPVVIEGVSASDFDHTYQTRCYILDTDTPTTFSSHFSSHKPAPEASLIIPAFRLATKWNFEDLKNYLLPLAEKELGAVDKIVLAREFGISEWLAPAHTELCGRVGSITADEAQYSSCEKRPTVLRSSSRTMFPLTVLSVVMVMAVVTAVVMEVVMVVDITRVAITIVLLVVITDDHY
ncbi:hypothetical protein FRC10_010302 [Ceratobasidium sp. 414]|nr:hypothetical protein FRC10_010302 [Ceratobasidium sp. 414]